MSLLGLCSGDPIVDTLREVFHANIIRVPEQRYKALSILAAKGSQITFRGMLVNVIKGAPPTFPDPTSSLMTEVTGKKTKSVKLDLGLKILGGFLQGMGAPALGLDAKFAKVLKVSYSFSNVIRYWVDDGVVGNLLIGKVIEKSNPAAAIYFGSDPFAFLVLDSVITSTQFTISVEKTSDTSFNLDVPGIQNIIKQSNADIAVSSSTGFELTFSGKTPLAFAFSCVQFALTPDGTVKAMVPDNLVKKIGFFAAVGHNDHTYKYSPDHVLLSKKSALLDFD